jgi:hypothetical protein
MTGRMRRVSFGVKDKPTALEPSQSPRDLLLMITLLGVVDLFVLWATYDHFFGGK